jgi:hypothetical protein
MIKNVFFATALASVLFLAVLLGTIIGGITGWVVGLIFPFIITSLNTVMGLELSGFAMGAMLGFVGTFFRSSTSSSKD